MVVKRLPLLMLSLLFPWLMQALTVSSGVNKNTLSLADQLTYKIIITDKSHINVSEPAPPEIKGFSFRNMTSGSSNMVSFNGLKAESEYSQTFEYYYSPQKTGTATIYPITVKVNNHPYLTQSHTVTVVQGVKGKPSQPAPAFPFPFDRDQQSPWDNEESLGNNTFLLALPESQTVYRGYPAIVSYYLYTDEIVRSFNLEDEKDYPGYGKTTYEQPSMLDYEDVRHQGRNYKRALLKRLVIIPNRDGELLAPTLQGIARLYSFGYLNKQLSSLGGKIQVRPLPRVQAPQGFGGAVGNFEVGSTLSKSQVSLGEAVTLTLKISGKGNFNQFPAPQFSAGQGIRISKPMVADNLKSGIEGTRVYYYTIIPQSKGELSLPPLHFVWFAHDLGHFRTWTLPQSVVKVTGAHVLSYFNRMLDQGAPRSMSPKLERTSYPVYRPIPGRWWYWLAVCAITLLSLVLSVMALARKKLKLNPELYARRNAEKTLNKNIKHAFDAAQRSSPDFYPIAETALWNYLDARYQLPNRLSTQEKMTRLSEQDMDEQDLKDLEGFLANCTYVRFMPRNELVANIAKDRELLDRIIDKIQNGKRINHEV